MQPLIRLALATQPSLPDLYHEDRALIPALAAHGIHAEPAVWSDDSVAWREFDGVVVRSCWDYYEDYGHFLRWLDALDAHGVRVWNDSRVLRWNTDKRYLLELSSAGIQVVESEILDSASVDDVQLAAATHGWTRIVVKPTVSANGSDTHAARVPLDQADRAVIGPVLARGPALVQRFAPEISATGEHSLMFIDGAYSHAAIKRPAPNDFRVQVTHGGSDEPFSAPEWMIEQAARALSAAPRPTLYARVDGLVRDGRFVLMELELTEPNLYFEFAPSSVERMAAALARDLA